MISNLPFNWDPWSSWLPLAILPLTGALVACTEAESEATCEVEPSLCENGGSGPGTTEPEPARIQGRTDSPEFARRGPHAVAYQAVEDDGSTLHLWYPSDDAPEANSEYEFEIQLEGDPWDGVRSASASGDFAHHGRLEAQAGRLPVALFSHGFGTSPEWYSSLLEHYASHGYLVVASLHRESDWLNAGELLKSRPEELTHALDLVEASEGKLAFLRDHIDWNRISVLGHSIGGYTALALGGARIAPAEFDTLCSSLPAEDPRTFLCAPFAGRGPLLQGVFGLTEAPMSGVYPSLLDDRIDAIVTIAGDAYLFAEEGLGYLELPVLSISGTVDFGTPYDLGAQLTYDAAKSEQKWLVGLTGGSHMLPANHCSLMTWPRELPELEAGWLCEDPVWDRERALDLIKHYSLAFLEAVPGQNLKAREALSQDFAATGIELSGPPVEN